MAVKVKGTFKKDDRIFNGLESIAADLIGKPHDRRLVVAVIETARIVDDIEDGGSRDVTIRLVHIEPINDTVGQGSARTLLETAYKARTGDTNALPGDPLPFDELDRDGDDEGGDQADTDQGETGGDGDQADTESGAPAVAFSGAK